MHPARVVLTILSLSLTLGLSTACADVALLPCRR